MPSTVTEVPEAARLITMIMSLLTIAILSFCLTRRLQLLKKWRTMSIHSYLIIAIYIDSFLFIFSTAILSKVYSLNQSAGICDGAILLCLFSYMSTKILIYYFLVEKCYVIRSGGQPRKKNKLWLFNFFGVICPFIVLVVLVIVYRISYLDKKGVCIIGMQRKALFPLVAFDLILNFWLTSLFLHPLRECYSYKQKSNNRLRTMVMRTFVGSCVTLVLSITNLTVIGVLNGEPGYICLCLCNFDILCTTTVLHWVTSVDKPDASTSENAKNVQKYGISKASVNASRHRPENYELDERPSKTRITAEKAPRRDDLAEEEMGEAVVVKVQVVQVVEVGSNDDSRSDSDASSQKRIFSGV